MPFPQFAVMIYLTVFIAFEIISVVLVFANYMDVSGGRYRTRRDFTEAAMFRVTSRSLLAILIYAGGFWE